MSKLDCLARALILPLSAAGTLLACSARALPVDPIESSGQALRPTDPSAQPPVFQADESIEEQQSPSGFFRIFFTRSGRDAVPSADDDGDGVPDFVQLVGREFEAVSAFYQQLGYRDALRASDVAGDDAGGAAGEHTFDVYLVDFPTSADGGFRSEACRSAPAQGCAGYMLVENDFAGHDYASPDAAIRLLASHEYFHAVQAAYLTNVSKVLAEGTAVWASEAFDSSLDDFEQQIPGYLARPDRPLGTDPVGAVDPSTYGSALFFEFLELNYGREVIRELLEALAAADDPANTAWPVELEAVLMQMHGSSLADAFARFAEWNLYTGARADPALSYPEGASYPLVTERAVTLPFSDRGVYVFPLSARYYAAKLSAASPLSAAADLTAGADPSGLAGLLAREHANAIVEIQHLDAAHDGVLTLNGEAGDTLHFLIFDQNTDGDAARPDVCIGSPDDVAKCRGSKAQTSAQGSANAAKGGGGCSSLGPGPSRPIEALGFGLAALGLLGWRRRRGNVE
jgi:MYXO-CTERM domain-containing protein